MRLTFHSQEPPPSLRGPEHACWLTDRQATPELCKQCNLFALAADFLRKLRPCPQAFSSRAKPGVYARIQSTASHSLMMSEFLWCYRLSVSGYAPQKKSFNQYSTRHKNVDDGTRMTCSPILWMRTSSSEHCTKASMAGLMLALKREEGMNTPEDPKCGSTLGLWNSGVLLFGSSRFGPGGLR